MNGFGMNFYGFFIFAAVWIGAYALWVRLINARERASEMQQRNLEDAEKR